MLRGSWRAELKEVYAIRIRGRAGTLPDRLLTASSNRRKPVTNKICHNNHAQSQLNCQPTWRSYTFVAWQKNGCALDQIWLVLPLVSTALLHKISDIPAQNYRACKEAKKCNSKSWRKRPRNSPGIQVVGLGETVKLKPKNYSKCVKRSNVKSGQGLPWQFSGQDSAFPMQGTRVQSLVREHKMPHASTKDPDAAMKTWNS